MDWLTLISAFGLFLVFEGILPFASPERFRLLLHAINVQSPSVLRMMGFLSMLLGLLIVSLAHYLLN